MSNPASYFDYQVTEFYNYLSKCLVEWNEMYNKRISDSWTPEIKHIAAKRDLMTFAEYWCYSLYRDCGVKRRYHRYGDELAETESAYNKAFYGKTHGVLVQLFYEKTAPGYNAANPITQLCRHLVFDMNSLSIISLGITKSLSPLVFETFVGCGGINPEGPNNKMPVILESFLEGTMVVFNPSMAKYKMTFMHTDDEAEQMPVEKTWALSTRKALGTSFFNNPGMSFQQMFDQNMEESGVDFGKIPLDFMMSHVLVFNVEHNENRVVHPEPRNKNTLVGAYKLGAVTECADRMGQIITALELLDLTALEQEGPDMRVKFDAFNMAIRDLRMAQIQPVDRDEIIRSLDAFGVMLDVPAKIAEFSGSSLAESPCIKGLLVGMDAYCPGVMITSPGGIRTKIRNTRYSEILQVKGNTPISVSVQNKKNLFKLYWGLKKSGQESIKKFLSVYDTPGKVYANIFDWYKNCIHDLTHHLYMWYMTAFVEKKKPASEIPYEFKPLVGELHKEYKATREPTTKDKVIKLINGLNWEQVYWRIFGPDKPEAEQAS